LGQRRDLEKPAPGRVARQDHLVTNGFKNLWTFEAIYDKVLQTKGEKMSNYDEGFQDGISFFKDQLLEWADTYEDAENYQLFYEKLIEKLEQ
jgi:hypothetical protein